MSSSLLVAVLVLELLASSVSAPNSDIAQHRYLTNETDAELLITSLLDTPFKKHDLMPGVTGVFPGKRSESPFPPLDDSWLGAGAAVGWVAFGVNIDVGFALGPIQYGVFRTVEDAQFAFDQIERFLGHQDSTRVFRGSIGRTMDWITHHRFTIAGGAVAQIDNVLVLSGVSLMRGTGPYDRPTTLSGNVPELFAIQQTGITHLYSAYAVLEEVAEPSDMGANAKLDGVAIATDPIVAGIGSDFSVNVTLSLSGKAENYVLSILLSPELQLLRDPLCGADLPDGCMDVEMEVLPQLDGSTAIDITGSSGGAGQIQIVIDLEIVRQALPGYRVMVASYLQIVFSDGRTVQTDTWVEVQYD